jgi:PAS domain S-box-containing protein
MTLRTDHISLPDERVYPILVTQIYRRSNIGVIGTAVNAAILVFILWEQILHWILMAWFSILMLVALIRIFQIVTFEKTAEKTRDFHKWGRRLVVGYTITGLLWGSTAIFLFPVNSVEHQVFIAFVLSGMVAGAVGVFSPIMPVFIAFSLPALVPVFIRFSIIGDKLHMAMGAMVMLFAILTYGAARRINRDNRELVELKETFADQLEDRTAELKRVNEQLRQEIEERKQAEQALADSERRLADIIEFLPDPTWVIDIDGRVIAWNRAIEQLTGIHKEEIIGKGGFPYAVPFYSEPRPSLIDFVLRRDGQWEKEYLSLREENGLLTAGESFHPSMGEDGRYFAATASRLCNAKGNVVGAIESIRDITAAKRSEQDRERLIAELQDAIAKVQTLSGLLPICSSCKKIRDDKGYWNQIETYISEHSTAEFSHSICPDCAKQLYPDLDIYPD